MTRTSPASKGGDERPLVRLYSNGQASRVPLPPALKPLRPPA